jgi:hypothetical protein
MKERQHSLCICRRVVRAAIGLAFVTGTASAGSAPPVVGDWQGTATWFSPENGTRQLQVVVQISQAENGSLIGTLGFPDMGTETVPLSVIAYKEPALHFEFQLGLGGGKKKGRGDSGGAAAKPAKYDGTINKDNSQIVGDVDPGQGGKMALVLKRIQ